jgi:hypothetical protein
MGDSSFRRRRTGIDLITGPMKEVRTAPPPVTAPLVAAGTIQFNCNVAAWQVFAAKAETMVESVRFGQCSR